jgi:two-component system, chemotaxis family, response regulator Rcp1
VNKLAPVEILLIEDNPGDICLTQEAIQEYKMKNNLTVIEDGESAMKFLFRKPPYEKAPRPDLILLDLNLPRKDGREILQEVKADPELSVIPVVVLTSSEADKDIMASYVSHANCYIKKPLDFDKFVEVVKGIEDFWFSIVRLPRN